MPAMPSMMRLVAIGLRMKMAEIFMGPHICSHDSASAVRSGGYDASDGARRGASGDVDVFTIDAM